MIVYNKKLDFSQIFLDQVIECISGNKRLVHVPYPRWFGLILSHEEGYVEIHGIVVPIIDLSSKFINTTPTKDDLPTSARMKKVD